MADYPVHVHFYDRHFGYLGDGDVSDPSVDDFTLADEAFRIEPRAVFVMLDRGVTLHHYTRDSSGTVMRWKLAEVGRRSVGGKPPIGIGSIVMYVGNQEPKLAGMEGIVIYSNGPTYGVDWRHGKSGEFQAHELRVKRQFSKRFRY